MNLVETVQQRHLVHWRDRGFVRTVEPHLLALLRGQRLALIARQVAGGPVGELQDCWKVIDVGDGLNVDPERTFNGSRLVPAHLLDLVHMTYASAAVDAWSVPVERK